MRLTGDALARRLAQGVDPAYTVCGDEPFLAEEAAGAVRAGVRAAGFDEREVLHAAARGFDWHALAAATANLSLFGGRRLVEVRLPGGKPGDDGARALVEYCEAPPPDTVLLLIAGKVDGRSRRSRWMNALDKVGVVCEVQPVPPARLPEWIVERMRGRDLQPHPDAVALLAERVEGNLLAAAQEIDKLALLHAGGAVDVDAVRAAVADSARYDLFRWVDVTVSGQSGRAQRMLEGMRAEGMEPTLILWALARELRTLATVTAAIARGDPVERALYAAHVWESRRAVVGAAAMRLKPLRIARLIRRAALADRVIKGMAPGSPWDELSYLTAGITGRSRAGATTVT